MSHGVVTATDMPHGVVSESLPQTCLTVWSVTATDISHGVVTATDMSHGVVSHCHRHVSRCGQSLTQTCLTVLWSLPLTDMSHGVVSHCHRHVSRCSGHCHRHVSRCGQSLQSQLVCRLVSPASTVLAAIDRLALFSRVTSFCPPTLSFTSSFSLRSSLTLVSGHPQGS